MEKCFPAYGGQADSSGQCPQQCICDGCCCRERGVYPRRNDVSEAGWLSACLSAVPMSGQRELHKYCQPACCG